MVQTIHRSTSSIAYRPEIDGLRAVAVLAVILYHLELTCIPAGYLGVDVFFVISGYLITSIITREIKLGEFSLMRFWSRRIRRILPALLTMLLITSVVSAVSCFKPDTVSYGVQGAAAALSVANFVLCHQNLGYWSRIAQETPFLHSWSLSVEEQFYLIYPPLLLLLIRYAGRFTKFVLTLAMVGSFMLYLQGASSQDLTTFYLLPARAWELTAGCLLAVCMAEPRRVIEHRHATALALMGMVLVAGSFLYFSASHRFPGYLVVPVSGCLLILGFTQARQALVRRFLALPPTIFVGKLSYSLYLWHWPVIALGTQCGLSIRLPSHLLLVLVLTLLFALASYRYVEATVRYRLPSQPALYICLALLVPSLGASAYLALRQNSYDVSRNNRVVFLGKHYDVNPATTKTNQLSATYTAGGIIHRNGPEEPTVVVLGDSHALMWSGLIDSITRELGQTTSFYATVSTSPFLRFPLALSNRPPGNFTQDQLLVYDQQRVNFLEEWRPKVVIIVARWEKYHTEDTKDLVELCGRTGAQVLLIEQPPVLYFGDRNAAQYLSYLRFWPKTDERRYLPALKTNKHEQGRQIVRSLCEQYPFCRRIAVYDLFERPADQAWILDGKTVLYYDDDHLSQAGAERASDRIWNSLRSALARE